MFSKRENQAICCLLPQGRTETEIFCKICPWLASILLSLKRVLWVSWCEEKGANILKNLREEGGRGTFQGRERQGGWWILRWVGDWCLAFRFFPANWPNFQERGRGYDWGADFHSFSDMAGTDRNWISVGACWLLAVNMTDKRVETLPLISGTT